MMAATGSDNLPDGPGTNWAYAYASFALGAAALLVGFWLIAHHQGDGGRTLGWPVVVLAAVFLLRRFDAAINGRLTRFGFVLPKLASVTDALMALGLAAAVLIGGVLLILYDDRALPYPLGIAMIIGGFGAVLWSIDQYFDRQSDMKP